MTRRTKSLKYHATAFIHRDHRVRRNPKKYRVSQNVKKRKIIQLKINELSNELNYE